MIIVRNLTKRFGQVVAVDNVSFEVGRGEIFAFLGPNGAGKTTTIKMLTTLISPTSGTLTLDGIDPVRNSAEARKRIGILFQDPTVDRNLTGWENVDLHGVLYGVSRRLRRDRMRFLLEIFGLWERRDDMVGDYSGGMIRRLEIVRALLPTPRILFMDEPTLGLDPQTRNQLWTQVRQLNRTEGVTVFLTTHYLDEADRASSRIAVIDHGKLIAIGSSLHLKERTGTESLEDAFLTLTGTAIREDGLDGSRRSLDSVHT